MTGIWNPDPPETLEIASWRFSEFLASEGFPSKICWLTREDILIGLHDYRYLIHARRMEGLKEAESTYALGLERGLGIALTAFCAFNNETFAYVIIPEDDIDRQHRLMGKGLKLSHPKEQRTTTVVLSELRWKILASRYAERSKMLWP